MGCPDHKRPLYLAASIKQIPIKRALVDTGAFVNLIPLSTLQATGISERKIQGCPMEVTRIRRKGRVHRRPHSVVAKSRPHSFSSLVPCSENRGILSCAFGRQWLHKYRLVPSTYHQCVKGRLNGRMIRIAVNPSPFEQAKAHLVKTMFYNQWASSGESSISKPRGTFVPKWKDIQDDPEPNLGELLARKRKRREASATESNDTSQCIRVRGPDGRIMYKL